MNTKTEEGKPHTTRKAFIMKKATLQYLVDLMNDQIALHGGEGETDANYVAARDELAAELNKGAAEKAARAAEYEAIHDLIMNNLTNTPVTVADLFAEIESDLPADMNRYKVQYALNNLWQDEIIKIAGKPNTYRRA
jgi:hypothetical protein